MKIAFSTASVPAWDVGTTLARAKAMGFDGVELGHAPDDLADVARVAKEMGVGIACLCTPASYTGRGYEDRVAGGVIESAVDAARALGCPCVRILDPAEGRLGESGLIRFGDFLAPLADYALQRDVTLLVENARSLRTARQLWTLLDRLNHPSLGVCWNVRSAVLAGESPQISVPVLNTRIHHVRLADARIDDRGVTAVQFGDGQFPIPALLNRLRGIGYGGYVSVAYGDLGENAEAFLAESLKRLREWTRPQVEAKAAKAVVAKSAAAAVKPA